jgi:lipopolysaccharide transport system permease protein
MTLASPGSTPTKLISAQRDSARQYANPVGLVRHLWAYRELIKQFTWRQVMQQYKGSYLGILWSFAVPLALLFVYTFVFSVIFRSRWAGAAASDHFSFALVLFAGLIVFNIFSEATLAAPTLVVNNPNYVKKVVFPLEVLSVSHLAAVVINSLFSVVILLIGTLIIQRSIPWTLILLPVVYLPLVLFCLGLSWFLASLGVFVRDIRYLLEVGVRMLLFLTPIFYPPSAVPAQLRFILYLNPLTLMVDHFRQVILFGQIPNWVEFGLLTSVTLVVCLLGYVWFMKSKKTFADII